jgi:hypothetical protein
MRRLFLVMLALCFAAGIALAQYGKPAENKPAGQAAAKPDFEITASYIEACSCDMFCPCYFNDHATMHGNMKPFCKANLVLKVDKGYYKATKLDGVKVWLPNDLGDFKTGTADWLVVIFDPSVSKEQQAAMNDVLLQLYTIHQKSRHLGVDVIPIQWNIDTKSGVATAKLGDGKGEVILERVGGVDPDKEVVIRNLKYWGAQSNDGFRMWKTKHEYYEGHGQKIDFSGTNGFLITIHFSGQAKPAAAD